MEHSLSSSVLNSPPTGELYCLVCGDKGASSHYGAQSCVGCKGFFRRALKKADQLECLEGGECEIKLGLRTYCRSCRLKKCLAVGMLPSVPTDLTQKRTSRKLTKKNALASSAASCNFDNAATDNNGDVTRDSEPEEDWMRKLNVETKTMLMTLLNIEAKSSKGDTSLDASKLYPLHISTLKEILEDPQKLKGKRSQMRYESFRMADNDELSSIAYRRLIAALDWVQFLDEMIDGGLSADDKEALVRASFAPLMVFAFSARTAQVTQDTNVLCLCNFAFVPRDMSRKYADAYHLANGLVDRTLDELVSPYRKYCMTEEEYVCVSAIIILNPLARDLSEEGADKVLQLRQKVQDALYAVVKESKPGRQTDVTYGNLLLSLVPVANLATTMCENLQFAQTFSAIGRISLLTNLFGCFPVEYFSFSDNNFSPEEVITLDDDGDNDEIGKKVSQMRLVQTARHKATQTDSNGVVNMQKKRRYSNVCSPVAQNTNPVEDDNEPREKEFRLLRAPGKYTLTEMFDDLDSTGKQQHSN